MFSFLKPHSMQFGLALLWGAVLPLNLFAQTGKSAEAGFSVERLPVAVLTASQVADGWIALFDGHSLFGWRGGSASTWQVKNGNLVASMGNPSLLRTSSQFDDFELLLEYTSETPWQVMLRTSPRPSAEDAVMITAPAAPDLGVLRLRVEGREVSGTWNQESIQPISRTTVLRGYFGLQAKGAAIRVKKILLRPLFGPASSLSSLTDWRSSESSSFEARQTSGQTISITGGPGYLESQRWFGNFVMQLQGRISQGGNSGVFFRCIPKENTNGYESQIDNSQLLGGDFLPANGGTGGIFRRKDARSVPARDEAWFAKTLVVEGPHVAVWVNGYQVTDWTDKREPDKNPRRGLRTSPGSLMLQGHDAQTTVEFRDIQVRELARRR